MQVSFHAIALSIIVTPASLFAIETLKGLPRYANIESVDFKKGDASSNLNTLKICLKIVSRYDEIKKLNFILANPRIDPIQVNDEVLSAHMPKQYYFLSNGNSAYGVNVNWISSLYQSVNVHGEVVSSKRSLEVLDENFDHSNYFIKYRLCEEINIPQIYDESYVMAYINVVEVIGFISSSASFSLGIISHDESGIEERVNDYPRFDYTIPIFGTKLKDEPSDGQVSHLIMSGFEYENEKNMLLTMKTMANNALLKAFSESSQNKLNGVKSLLRSECSSYYGSMTLFLKDCGYIERYLENRH